MNEITKKLYISTWILHLNKAASGLDYLSRIDGEPASWYLWLNKVPGVYEIKLKEAHTAAGIEQSSFYLKYYPDENEAVFDAYSCAEQLLRLGELFDQNLVRISESEEICPCCGGKDVNCRDARHNFLVRRPKGIPTLTRRQLLEESLFTIGEIRFEMQDSEISKCILVTEKLYETRAEDGIYLTDSSGKDQELVAPGAVDRSLPGYELSRRIYDFVISKMMGALEYTPGEEIMQEAGNEVVVTTSLATA